jgi:HK97 family phage portal protein
LISADLHLDGNSYAWIDRGSNTGRIRNLWRFLPNMMRLATERGVIDYYARRSDGTEQRFEASEILHIRGLGYDGVRGYNPIHLMREELGWTLGTRKFSSKYYRNAFRPSGLLISPSVLKEPAKSGLINALRESGKEGGLALIEGALDFKPMGIPQNDAQFLETMQFQDDRVAGSWKCTRTRSASCAT